MKKLLMGAVSLLIISIAITVSQLSCQKASAGITSTTGNTPYIVYGVYPPLSSTVTDTTSEQIWIVQPGVTQPQQVVLPSSYYVNGFVTASNGSVVYFTACYGSTEYGPSNLYQCNVDGTNITQITSQTAPGYGTYLR